jgi:hypothetical protein
VAISGFLISPHRLSQKAGREQALPEVLECGGKLSATPLWFLFYREARIYPKRRRRFASPAHSK